jgi:hypothetical protein
LGNSPGSDSWQRRLKGSDQQRSLDCGSILRQQLVHGFDSFLGSSNNNSARSRLQLFQQQR